MSKMPRFPCITAPIGELNYSKMLNFPISITVPEFVEVHLHDVHEVGGSLQSLLCLQSGVELKAVKFVPCLLCSRHEHPDL